QNGVGRRLEQLAEQRFRLRTLDELRLLRLARPRRLGGTLYEYLLGGDDRRPHAIEGAGQQPDLVFAQDRQVVEERAIDDERRRRPRERDEGPRDRVGGADRHHQRRHARRDQQDDDDRDLDVDDADELLGVGTLSRLLAERDRAEDLDG